MDNAPVQLPASWLDAGYGIPSCCVRHGNPAATARKVQFISRPPAWAYLLLIAGVLPFLIVSLVMRKTATPQAWPFCAQCQSQRAKGLGIGFGLLVLSVVLFIVPFVVAGDSAELGPIGLLFPLSLFVFFAGLLFAALNGWVGNCGRHRHRRRGLGPVREGAPELRGTGQRRARLGEPAGRSNRRALSEGGVTASGSCAPARRATGRRR